MKDSLRTKLTGKMQMVDTSCTQQMVFRHLERPVQEFRTVIICMCTPQQRSHDFEQRSHDFEQRSHDLKQRSHD